jgi:hypothetical protein
MSGTPSKMLEHLLDTRLGIQMGPTNDDSFLDDFLLTHIVFMPVAQLVDELASHYHNDTENHPGAESPDDYDYILTCKKRVVQFIQRWVMAVRHAAFEDPAAAHFIEVSSKISVKRKTFRFYDNTCENPPHNTCTDATAYFELEKQLHINIQFFE